MYNIYTIFKYVKELFYTPIDLKDYSISVPTDVFTS